MKLVGGLASTNLLNGRLFRPAFFLFLVCGPFVLAPYLLLSPTRVLLRAAWSKSPLIAWRMATAISVAIAFFITCPPSPWFVGYDFPLPSSELFELAGGGLSPLTLIAAQCVLINAALVAQMALLPLTAASTCHTIAQRRRRAPSGSPVIPSE